MILFSLYVTTYDIKSCVFRLIPLHVWSSRYLGEIRLSPHDALNNESRTRIDCMLVLLTHHVDGVGSQSQLMTKDVIDVSSSDFTCLVSQGRSWPNIYACYELLNQLQAAVI